MPGDIAHCCDNQPVQPHCRSFPKTKIGDRSRSFAVHWYQSYSFIEHFLQRNLVYCFCCRFFPSHSSRSDTVFTEKGFNNWKKIGDKLKKHAESDSHKESVVRWAAYMQTKSSGTIANQLLSQRAKTIASNCQYIVILSKLAVLLACQNIPFRGHDESRESDKKGNFAEILELLFSLIPEFKHFNSAPKNAKYVPKNIQNDLVTAFANVVQQQICEEIRESEGFVIIADEARDVSSKEQLSLCLRYINKHLIVNECFVGFSDLSELNAKALSEKIVEVLTKLGLDIKKCIGQCYDGASVMSGAATGVHQRINEIVSGGCILHSLSCPQVSRHCMSMRYNTYVIG